MTHDTNIPRSRLERVRRMAKTGLKTGFSLLTGRGTEAAAQEAARVLGEMRGLAAKAGQMASYVDGFVPEAHRAVFETSLKKLRAAAPVSSPAAIRRVV